MQELTDFIEIYTDIIHTEYDENQTNHPYQQAIRSELQYLEQLHGELEDGTDPQEACERAYHSCTRTDEHELETLTDLRDTAISLLQEETVE